MNERASGLIQRAAERLRRQHPAPAVTSSLTIPPPEPDDVPPLPPPHPAPAEHPRLIGNELIIDRQLLAKAGITFSVSERSRVAEEIRIITRQILAKADTISGVASRVIMVTSARPREGKTFVSMSLSLAIASQPDFHVLSVDCDVERQSMTALFGIAPEKGFVDLLADDRTDMRDVLLRTDIPNLSVLPVGPWRAGVPELLSSRRTRDILTEMAQRYADRYIVIDAPPCLATSDPSILASFVGQVVFVVEANRTQTSEVEESIRLVSACPNISLVLNKVEGAASDHFGSYGYY